MRGTIIINYTTPQLCAHILPRSLTSNARSLGYPLSGPDPESLAPNEHWNRQKPKDTHQHRKDAERFSRALMLDPSADEEGPGESDDGPNRSDRNKAIS